MTRILLLGKDKYNIKGLLEDKHPYSIINILGLDDLKAFLQKDKAIDIILLCNQDKENNFDIPLIMSIFYSFEINIPLILLSDTEDDYDSNSLILWNVSSYLHPPFNASQLTFAIEKSKKQYQDIQGKSDYEKTYLEIVYKFKILADIVKKANSSLERKIVVDSIMQKIEEIIKCEGWSLLLLDKESNKLIFEASKGAIGKQLLGTEMPADAGIVGKVIKSNTPLIINDVNSEKSKYSKIDENYNFNTKSIICIPLISQGVIIGAIEIVNKKYNKLFTSKDMELLQILSEPAAIALQNCFLYEKTKELSLIDDLSQLYNSRYLNHYLEKELERGKRSKQEISMVFFDIDGFKNINDKYGHLAGSQVLSEVGKLLKDSIRKMDTAIRYGGDEFIIILPETSTENSINIVRRLRHSLNSHSFLSDLGINTHLTASFGLSTFPYKSKTKEELINHTDSAMYYVKDRGKDGIYVYKTEKIIR